MSIIPAEPFWEIVDQTLRTLSDSTSRMYLHIYKQWYAFCVSQSLDPLIFLPVNVNRFLETQNVTWETRKNQMTMMRSLASMHWTLTGEDQAGRILNALRSAKATKVNLSNTERDRKALTPAEVYKVLAVWNKKDTLSVRNHALIAFLMMTGVRRSEIAALEWRDVDLENYSAVIRHGKGDKERVVTIVGDEAIDSLRELWARFSGHQYVFTPVVPYEDKPLTADSIYAIVKRTETLSGVKFSPHTARRTLITEALATGTPLADVQAQAGHADPTMTLKYARPVDAKKRRERFHLRY